MEKDTKTNLSNDSDRVTTRTSSEQRSRHDNIPMGFANDTAIRIAILSRYKSLERDFSLSVDDRIRYLDEYITELKRGYEDRVNKRNRS